MDVPNPGTDSILVQQVGMTGTLGWTRVIGTSDVDNFSALMVNASEVDVSGYTQGQFTGQQKYGTDATFTGSGPPEQACQASKLRATASPMSSAWRFLGVKPAWCRRR